MVWQVLIVEDDPQMREFFVASVLRAPQLALAGSAGSVAQAKACLDRHGAVVDVLLTDLGLPDGSGLDVIRHARVGHPECEPLVISMFGDEENVLASIEAGALGYIHKDATPDDIAMAILQMKAGASPISPMIARRVLARYQGEHPQSKPSAQPGKTAADAIVSSLSAALSRREQEVLELIARGFSYNEIAGLTGISVHTVQTHIKNLYRKLAVSSKSEAVYEATKLGLLNHHA
jgi:DNA-binding NarL/FixJ family response regulator